MANGDFVEINLAGKVLLFDREDLEFLQQVGWSVTDNRVYLVGAEYKGKLFHRVIAGAVDGLQVDHINGNSLDNRKSNLRLCTRTQNLHNTKVRKDKKLDLPKGVYKHRSSYRAKITVHKQVMYLGTFSTPEEADLAYKRAAEKYFGEFAAHLSRDAGNGTR